MNRLQGHLTYLSGAMENAADGGLAWRDRLTPQLQELGVGVLNPCDKPSDYALETQEKTKRLKAARTNGDFQTIRDIMSPIIHIDLRLVDICSFFILYLDMDVHTSGSLHELVVAIQQRKPTLIVCKQGRTAIPLWWMGLVPHEFFFDDFDDMLCYLRHVAYDNKIDDHHRWLFFDYDKVYGVENAIHSDRLTKVA